MVQKLLPSFYHIIIIIITVISNTDGFHLYFNDSHQQIWLKT